MAGKTRRNQYIDHQTPTTDRRYSNSVTLVNLLCTETKQEETHLPPVYTPVVFDGAINTESHTAEPPEVCDDREHKHTVGDPFRALGQDP
jgi:hypothetical protein